MDRPDEHRGGDDVEPGDRRPLDAHLVDPYRHSRRIQPIHQIQNPIPVLRCVTNENLGVHGSLIDIQRMVDFFENFAEAWISFELLETTNIICEPKEGWLSDLR